MLKLSHLLPLAFNITKTILGNACLHNIFKNILKYLFSILKVNMIVGVYLIFWDKSAILQDLYKLVLIKKDKVLKDIETLHYKPYIMDSKTIVNGEDGFLHV